MPLGVLTKPQSVKLVGKQQLLTTQGGHRHRGVQRFKHDGEALVRAGQLLPDAIGLRDVGHRRHPARLLASGIDQGRNVHSRIKQLAAFAFDPHLKACGRVLPADFLFQPLHQQFPVLVWPIREGGFGTDQI
jgi:hypothetical protein